jgi:uncharacterized protein DUF4440
MARGAATPEELETLLEDAFVLRDATAAARLFEPGGLFCSGSSSARGRSAIARQVAALLEIDRPYVAGDRRVLQAGDVAVLLGQRTVIVARRGQDRTWHYSIAVHGLDG